MGDGEEEEEEEREEGEARLIIHLESSSEKESLERSGGCTFFQLLRAQLRGSLFAQKSFSVSAFITTLNSLVANLASFLERESSERPGDYTFLLLCT